MEGIVVIGVVPIDRPRRHKAFLVGRRRISQRLERRLAHLRVVEMQLAVIGDDVLAAIGDQERVEQGVGVVAGRVELETEGIDMTHALGAQFFLHLLEKIVKGIPRSRQVLHRVTGLLDQRPPDMVRLVGDCIRHTIKAALLLDAVVAIDGEQGGPSILRFLCLDHVRHIDQPVLPGIERNNLGGSVLEQIGDDAARHRRDDLLAHRRIGNDAEVDRVAARLLVIGDDLFECDILLLREALHPPHSRSGRRRICEVRPR